MSALDINTPAGQKTLLQEWAASYVWASHYPRMRYVQTNKVGAAAIDGFLERDETLLAAVEVKCRTMSEQQFDGEFRSEWLITADKVRRACTIAKLLQLPLLGWLYLVNDGVLIWRKLADADGNLIVRFREETTETQATVNGGKATRLNMFVDMHGAERIR